jgi:hypothetical protein
MKILKCLLLILFFPFIGFAQSLNGIWTGVLSNDSTTIRKDQSFEMALTEYRGRVYGYAYSTFIVNDTLYYIVKRVKGKVEGDICEVEDDDVVSHNFPQKPEKGVYVTYTLRRNSTDSTWTLDGNWKTNSTKRYYAISGKVETKEEKDISKSKLYEHLGDLNLQQTLAFNKPADDKKTSKTKTGTDAIAKKNVTVEKKKDVGVAEQTRVDLKQQQDFTKTETRLPEPVSTDAFANNRPAQTEKKTAAVTEQKQPEKKPQQDLAKTEIKQPEPVSTDISINNRPAQTEKKTAAVTEQKQPEKKQQQDLVKTETRLPETKTATVTVNNPTQTEKKTAAVTEQIQPEKKPQQDLVKTETRLPETKTATVTVTVNNPTQTEKKTAVVTEQKQPEKKQDAEYVFTELKRTDRKLKPASALVDGRQSAPSETISFKSDSLVLALYDNGEIDGDTVSVILNDEVIIEKLRLKSSAFKKTIYITPETGDSLLLVLYAENLGLYPPNTGLLTIRDGDELYYVRFKADYDRNAAIVLRRKYK